MDISNPLVIMVGAIALLSAMILIFLATYNSIGTKGLRTFLFFDRGNLVHTHRGTFTIFRRAWVAEAVDDVTKMEDEFELAISGSTKHVRSTLEFMTSYVSYWAQRFGIHWKVKAWKLFWEYHLLPAFSGYSLDALSDHDVFVGRLDEALLSFYDRYIGDSDLIDSHTKLTLKFQWSTTFTGAYETSIKDALTRRKRRQDAEKAVTTAAASPSAAIESADAQDRS